MADKFQIQIEVHKYIHNDLANCARGLRDVVHEKFRSDETDGVFYEMMGSMIFIAFAIESKVNFVGWKSLENGWPERANLREKIDLLIKVLPLELSWQSRPLQTISKLKKFRDIVAHGKPEFIQKNEVMDSEPEVFDALKGVWESYVTQDFIDRSYEDMNSLWDTLLEAANIPIGETVTRSFQSTTFLRE